MNYLLTGKPGVGKTTILKRLCDEFGDVARGFLTVEVREDGHRIGFDVVAFDGERGILARKGLSSRYHVGRYGVDVDSFERIAIPALHPVEDKILVIDEIGKMELHSRRFRCAVLDALDSECIVIGAIMHTHTPFTDSIRSRKDVRTIKVTYENRNEIPDRLLRSCAES